MIIVKDATKALQFKITQQHVDTARRKLEEDKKRTGRCERGRWCVIAQAMTDALGDLFDEVWVGVAITKIFLNGKKTVVRYKTPKVLADALRCFDNSEGKEWNLKENVYALLPITKREQMGRRKHIGAKRLRAEQQAARVSRKNRKRMLAEPTATIENHRQRTLPSRVVKAIRLTA